MSQVGDGAGPWSLFGLDLERYARSVALGVRQLLWGSESRFQGYFSPKSLLVGDTQHLDVRDVEKFALMVQADESPDSIAILLPDDLVLTKCIELPLAAEPELESLARLEAEVNSPFATEATSSGWRILNRGEQQLTLLMAIASRYAINTHLSETQGHYRLQLAETEVWADHGGRLVQLSGFGEARRKAAYLSNLSRTVAKVALMVAGLTLIALWPAGMLAVKAHQLREMLADTELRAGTATAARNALIDTEDRLSAATDFYSDRLLYDRWLDRIASLTPDSAYLTNIRFDKNRLTIVGQASNAAALQTTLANVEGLSEVAAPTAFTRDRRTNKERYTLTMRIEAPLK